MFAAVATANSCGDGLTWELNGDTLAISFDGEGTGAMDNWDSENPAPWYDDAPDIKYVEIAEGVTSIGAYAFADCDFFFIDLPASVTSIGENAFSNIAGQGITILSTSCTLPQDLVENGNFERIFVPAASVATYQALFPDDDYRFVEIPSVQQTDNVILWDYNLCTSIMAGSPRDELEILNYHNTQGGITVTAEVDYMHGDVEAGFMYGGIVFECSGKLIFTSAVGNITHIEISGDGYDDPEIAGWTWTPGEGGDNGTLSWTGNAASVELPIAYPSNLENTEIEFTLEGGEPAPDFAGEGTEQSPYLIASADDWSTLATRVSEGNTYSGEYFQLTNDIAISTMVGTSAHNFNGTFDGAGNTITATLSSDAACCAPFAYTFGATIKNLHTSGTITTTGDNAGGVVGRNGTASLTLTNVSSDMTINSTKANGGLVGYTINATISGCAFTGKLLSESNRRIGGFVGWKSNTTGSYLTITDCVFDPEEVTNGNSSSKTFVAIGGGTVTITNCYYTQAISADQGKLMHAITAGEGVLVLNTGSATIYNVSGITSYGTGISYDNVLYGGNGDEISLNLSGSNNGYEASTGTLSGTENPYTLTMADADCQINKLAPDPTAVEDVQSDKVQCTKMLIDGMIYIVRDGKLFNLQGAQVK